MTVGPNDDNGPFDDGENEFANDDEEVVGNPNQEFDWEYTDDEDAGAAEGRQENGSYVEYSIRSYYFRNIDVSVYKITMRITNDPTFPDRSIDRYMTYKTMGKYRANGVTSAQALFEHGESRDDMEYFMRRLQLAEKNNTEYISPV